MFFLRFFGFIWDNVNFYICKEEEFFWNFLNIDCVNYLFVNLFFDCMFLRVDGKFCFFFL